MDRKFVSCLALVLWTFHSAFPASNLPPLPTPNGLDQPDWLIDSSSYKAGVYQGQQTNEIVLSNGLIQRRFRLAPNAATVGFDNLITGESLLRGVKPEAQVELDGVLYDIGGLKGQPNYAFLRPEWIKLLQADPGAFQFEGFETGQPRERLSWKRLRHHAPHLEWPPKGLYLRMDYRMPNLPRQSLSSTPQPSAKGRRMLLSEDFKALDQAWNIHTSPAHPRSSFSNEGKTGEIYTPANTAVFAERALPEGTRLVEATIDPGTDNSSSWGPGLALVWPDHTIKFNLRPGGNATLQGTPLLGLWDGKGENPGVGGKILPDLSKPWTLRLRIESGTVFCEARSEGSPWKLFEQIVLDPSAGFPTSVRVGKMDRTGGKQDYSDPGDLVRLRVRDLTVYSGLEKAALAAMEASRADRQKIKVSVHYELYDGLPCLSKWITVHNGSRQPVTVNRFTSEILAAVEHSSRVEDRGIHYPPPNIHVETDFSFQGMDVETVSKHSVHWVNDPQYTSQVQYLRNTPCLLEVRPEIGPDQVLEPGE
jgi:hypothetical protein